MNKTNLLMQIKYDLVAILNEVMVIIFGFFFPTIMAVIIISGSSLEDIVPIAQLPYIHTSIIITIALMIPVALMLVSAATTFSMEVEQGISFRLQLFGKNKQFLLLSKIITFFILMTISFIIYFLVLYSVYDLVLPSVSSAIIYFVTIYLFGALLLVLAYSLAHIFKRFGIVFAIALPLQFVIMILGGMMGFSIDKFPEPMRVVASMLPTYFINKDFGRYWADGFAGYNFAPLIQSFIFCFAFTGVIYCINLYSNRKHN